MSVTLNHVLPNTGTQYSQSGLRGLSLQQVVGRIVGYFALIWVTALFVLSSAIAQTVASGAISSNTTWRAADGPYVVTADVIVQNNAILTIEPGTQIYMGASTGMAVINGAIRANGTATAPIRVQSDKLRLGQSAVAGDWNRWVFNASSTSSSLTYVQFDHGKGLEVNSTTLNINNSIIRSSQGPAISQNLSASLVGAGNSASGNTINAAVVPAGDIAANVRWGLKGIPYLIATGTVSIGASPQITGVNPNVMQSGETVTAVVTGTRLIGASQAKLSGGGITAQILSGATDTQLSLLLTAQAGSSGEFNLSLLTDAGEVNASAAVTVVRPQPKIIVITPSTMYANRGDANLVVSGSNFVTGTVVLLDDVPLVSSYQSATQLQATVPNQTLIGSKAIKLRTPDPLNVGGYLTSNAATLLVNTPQASLDPSSVSMIDGSTQAVSLVLPFAAPAGGLQFSMASSAPLIASAPAVVTVSQGQQSVSFTVQASSVGSAQLTVSRSGWNSTLLRVTVIEPPRTLAFTPVTSALVGIVVGTSTTQISGTSTYGPILSNNVGIIVGSAITQVTPKAAVVGTSSSITLQGFGLTDVTAIGVLPATSVSFAAPVISGDGKQISVAVTVDAAAAKGARRLSVSTGTGSVTFVNPEDIAFLIAAPSPILESVSPQVIVAGQAATKLTVRGSNLRDITGVRFEPSQGIAAVGAFTANTDGTALEFNVQANVAATSGPRVVVVQAAGGESSATSAPSNTLQVARQIGNNFNAISSALVGVQVGASTPAPVTATLGPVVSAAVGVLVGTTTVAESTQTVGPVTAPSVGVIVGGVATQITPKVGVVGTQVTITISGVALGGVTAVDFLPNTGLTVSGLTVNADGMQLTVNVSIAADAVKTQRLLVLSAVTGRLNFSNPADALFLVAAPAPTLISVAPQVVVAGQALVKLAVRGINFRDVTGVRFDPPAGISAIGAATATTDGTLLEVNVQADAAAVSGPRTLIVMTAGGESSAIPVPANTLQVARQVGSNLQAIASPLVGIVVGSVTTVVTEDRLAQTQVGVVVGAVASALQPGGAIKGSSGQLQITGAGLDSAVAGTMTLSNPAVTASGVILGAATVNALGTQLTVPYSVAANAPSAQYKLSLVTGAGTVLFNPAASSLFSIIDEPQISSLSPTVMQRGKAYMLEMRGSKLQNVRSITLENSNGPLAGITVEANALAFTTDGLGDKLSVRVVLDATTALGPVVLRLSHAGGATSSQASTANTINIVNP